MRKILVQDSATKRFLDERGKWTSDAETARNFPTSLNAIVHCVQNELGHVQLFVRVDGPPSRELVFPINDDHSRIARDFANHRSEH